MPAATGNRAKAGGENDFFIVEANVEVAHCLNAQVGLKSAKNIAVEAE